MSAPVTDLDRRQRDRVPRSTRASGESPTATNTPTGDAPRQPQPRKGERWATYNAFVDNLAPHLTLAERAVWHVMFRHARDGTCDTTARRLAKAANVSISTAQKALGRLQQAGLVRLVWKATDKSKSSRYGIHPSPADCLAAVMKHTNRTNERHG